MPKRVIKGVKDMAGDIGQSIGKQGEMIRDSMSGVAGKVAGSARYKQGAVKDALRMPKKPIKAAFSSADDIFDVENTLRGASKGISGLGDLGGIKGPGGANSFVTDIGTKPILFGGGYSSRIAEEAAGIIPPRRSARAAGAASSALALPAPVVEAGASAAGRAAKSVTPSASMGAASAFAGGIMSNRDGIMGDALKYAVVGGVAGGTINAVQGEDFWDGAGRGALIGAGAGAFRGAARAGLGGSAAFARDMSGRTPRTRSLFQGFDKQHDLTKGYQDFIQNAAAANKNILKNKG